MPIVQSWISAIANISTLRMAHTFMTYFLVTLLKQRIIVRKSSVGFVVEHLLCWSVNNRMDCFFSFFYQTWYPVFVFRQLSDQYPISFSDRDSTIFSDYIVFFGIMAVQNISHLSAEWTFKHYAPVHEWPHQQQGVTWRLPWLLCSKQSPQGGAIKCIDCHRLYCGFNAGAQTREHAST